MNCPIQSTPALPSVDLCRSHRRENRELGPRLRQYPWCDQCGRDLGAKGKDMGVKPDCTVSREVANRAVQGANANHGTTPTKDAQGEKNASLTSRPGTAGDKQADKQPPISKMEVGSGSPRRRPPLTSAAVRPKEQEGRATGKDAPRPLSRHDHLMALISTLASRNRPHSNRFMSFAGGPIAPRTVDPPPVAVTTRPEAEKRQEGGKAQENPAKVRLCPSCKFPLSGNGGYCGLCAPIRTRWKEDPARMAQELAEVKRRREAGLVRQGHGFQRGRTRQGMVRKGWPKGKPREKSAMDRHRWADAVVGAAG